MGRRKIWAEIRVCPVCHNKFMPEYSNQVYCCASHSDIARRAKASKYGRELLENNPDGAMQWYGDREGFLSCSNS